MTQGAGHRAALALGDERLDAALDLVAMEQADRIVAAGQAGDERLQALEALLVQAAQLGQGSSWSSTRRSRLG
jgi:hypothetical protein